MDTQTVWEQAERASEARHGARMMRDTRLSAENARYWACELASGRVREDVMGTMHDASTMPTMLPEAAMALLVAMSLLNLAEPEWEEAPEMMRF